MGSVGRDCRMVLVRHDGGSINFLHSSPRYTAMKGLVPHFLRTSRERASARLSPSKRHLHYCPMLTTTTNDGRIESAIIHRHLDAIRVHLYHSESREREVFSQELNFSSQQAHQLGQPGPPGREKVFHKEPCEMQLGVAIRYRSRIFVEE